MVNKKHDQSTEQRILEAAKKVFVEKGMAGARMQDIADQAGINKALLHYYFRSKEKLFEMIFIEASARLFSKLNDVFTSDEPIFRKIERFCEDYISEVMENPYLPLFVMNEIHRDPEYFFRNIWAGSATPRPQKFLEQFAREVKKGTIRKVDPLHLLINLVSMTIFPFIAKPLVQKNFGLNDPQFRTFMEQRKKEIPAFIIRSISK